FVDARWTIGHRPHAWLRGQGRAWSIFFYDPSNYLYLYPNAAKLHGWSTAYRHLTLQARPSPTDIQSGFGRWALGEHPVAGFVIAFGALLSPAIAWRRSRRGEGELWRAIIVLVGAIVLVCASINATDVGENQRLRMPLDPVVLALAATALPRVGKRAARS